MTANDSDVSDGDILTGSQVVRVYGENLTAPFVTLMFGGVEYTPLYQGEGYIEFILGDNGTAVINVDGSPFMSFEVEGIVIPSDLPKRFSMWQSDSVENPLSNPINQLTIDGNCINYAYLSSQNLPSFLIRTRLGSSIDDVSRFAFYNCVLVRSIWAEKTGIVLGVVPINANDVCWVTFDDFIIAVFNYTTN